MTVKELLDQLEQVPEPDRRVRLMPLLELWHPRSMVLLQSVQARLTGLSYPAMWKITCAVIREVTLAEINSPNFREEAGLSVLTLDTVLRPEDEDDRMDYSSTKAQISDLREDLTGEHDPAILKQLKRMTGCKINTVEEMVRLRREIVAEARQMLREQVKASVDATKGVQT